MQTIISKSGERLSARRYDTSQLLALIARRQKRQHPAPKREAR